MIKISRMKLIRCSVAVLALSTAGAVFAESILFLVENQIRLDFHKITQPLV